MNKINTENIEDLQINNYKIYQNDKIFKIGTDAILLSNYIINNYKNKFINKAKKNTNTYIFDLCSGGAIIPLLLHAHLQYEINNKIYKPKIKALDINKEAILLSKKSLELNKKQNAHIDIQLINDDLKNIYLNKNNYSNDYTKYDIVTVNPPYIKINSGIKSNNENDNISRNEIFCTFDDISLVSSKLLKNRGAVFFIQKASRLAEIIITLKKYNLEPKKIQFIQYNIHSKPDLFLMQAIKDAKENVQIEPPLIISKEENKK
ncbi:MAG: hypothetical protein Q4F88_03940 [Eubacteriales bacterium]|nr:hypothetical protein [Eubacteriales bacterium]